MRKYLFLIGFVSCFAMMGVPAARADRAPLYCYETNNGADVTFDYTVYFKHDFPKKHTDTKNGGHKWCGAGFRTNDEYAGGEYVNENGCCVGHSICEDNANMCCMPNGNKYKTIWEYLKTDLEANNSGACGQNLAAALRAIPVLDDTRILLIATADKTGKDAHNRDLAERRLWDIKQLFTPEQQERIITINGGESNDNFTKTNGRNVDERSVRIMVAGTQKIEEIREIIVSNATYTTNTNVTVLMGDADNARARIESYAKNIRDTAGSVGTSVWKDKKGNFNTARLASDSIAGVVLGTAGGLITSHVIKKNQLKGGFEDIKCTIGGQVVAEYGDDFAVGMK